TFVTGCKKARAVSILIRGGTEHVVDEVERILHDALRVVAAAIEDGKAIAGGGSAEIELSIALKDYAATVGAREQLAIEAFAGARWRRTRARRRHGWHGRNGRNAARHGDVRSLIPPATSPRTGARQSSRAGPEPPPAADSEGTR